MVDSRAPVQRLAIVLQNTSTGGWRYVCRLVAGLKTARKSLQVTVFLGRSVRKVCKSESPQHLLESLGAEVREMPPLVSSRHRQPLRRLAARSKEILTSLSYRRWIAQINSYDCVLFAWPYGIDCPILDCPAFFVPHDLNYLHFTGSFVGDPTERQNSWQQHERWLANAFPIVSTQFIADELVQAFPRCPRIPRVIHLSNLGQNDALEERRQKEILHSMGINGDYILSLNNASPHKNLGQLLSAFHYISRERPSMSLVLAGSGTEEIRGNVNHPFYLDYHQSGAVQSLGLRSDLEVQVLTANAKVVVNSSLYEAGNGSGLDAWSLGTPVAMSAIPAFLEQKQVLGVEAQTFNPRCCYEIRDAIMTILDAPEESAAAALRSRVGMQNYGWRHVADKYLACFDGSLVRQPVSYEEAA